MVGGAKVNRQDMGGVRTAQDLERKYPLKDLVGMKQAVRLTEEGLHKTNDILQTFINSTLKSESNMQSQTDGQITTWFANGEPTIANEPMVYWETDEQKAQHIGDLYYDRDTGYAYEFTMEDDSYKWAIITDTETIEALAIANSGYDTKDNQRRVFVEVPYPPYENGDLWFDGTDIYICQISKGAINGETGDAEVYVEGDFIIATKYTDNTIANQVGEELKVLKGTVLTVIEDANQFKVDVENKDAKTRTTIEALDSKISSLVRGPNGESLIVQHDDGLYFDMKSYIKALDNVSEVASYMSVTDVNGEPQLELGTSKNGFKSVHTNRGIAFITDNNYGNPSTEITHEGAEIDKVVVRNELQIGEIGGFLLKERDNGNVGFVWRGGDE